MTHGIESALTVTTYDKFQQFVTAFARGNIPLLLLVGPPGVSKSQSVRRAIRSRSFCWIEGQATPISIYCDLYQNRHKLIVIDDVDSLYSNDSARRLLKSLCQSDVEKEVAWNTMNNHLEATGTPKRFMTRSKVCIITNEWRSLDSHTKAIEDRAVTVIFQPTALEVHKHVATWFDDQEAFNFIGSILWLVQSPSGRHYLFARSLRRARIKDWKKLVIERIAQSALRAVAQIEIDETLITRQEKAVAYVAAGHGSRASYFRYAKKLPPRVQAPLLKVRGTKESVSKSQRPQLRIAK